MDTTSNVLEDSPVGECAAQIPPEEADEISNHLWASGVVWSVTAPSVTVPLHYSQVMPLYYHSDCYNVLSLLLPLGSTAAATCLTAAATWHCVTHHFLGAHTTQNAERNIVFLLAWVSRQTCYETMTA